MHSFPAIVAAGLVALSSLGAVAATPFQFHGEVQKDSLDSTAFGLSVDPGQVVILDMPGDLLLEVSTPLHNVKGAVTVVRLLRQTADPKRFAVMHEATTPATSDEPRSLSYLVCGAKLTFLAPAPMTTPKCSE